MTRRAIGQPAACIGLATDGWEPYHFEDGSYFMMHYVDGIEVCGLRMHVAAYKTYDDKDGCQQTYDPCGIDGLVQFDEGGRFETVEIEDHPGDWVIVCTPFCT